MQTYYLAGFGIKQNLNSSNLKIFVKFSYNFLHEPLHPFAIFLLLYINLDVELFYLSLILVLFICVNEILLELYTGGRVGPHLIKSSSVMSACWAWATEREVRARQQQNRCNNIPAAEHHPRYVLQYVSKVPTSPLVYRTLAEMSELLKHTVCTMYHNT